MAVERTSYRVIVDGQDISSVLNPILIELSVSLQAGASSDSASITIDDTGGAVRIPRDDAAIRIELGYSGRGFTEVFRGKVNDVKSSGGRSGRTLAITCSGMDTKGKAKQPRDKHFDDKTVAEILRDAAKAAGYNDVSVDDEIGSVKLAYFGQIDTSLVHLGQKLARDFGGTFKVMGDKVVMVKRGAGRSASGKPLMPVAATYGVNLIDWSVTPFIGRPRHRSVQTRWYDRDAAKWVTETADTSDKGGKAIGRARFTFNEEVGAKRRASAEADEADRNKGDGQVTINGEPMAQPEARCTISGARPGVDGTYTIDAVTHNVARSGYTTSLSLKRPEGGAGQDNR